MLVLTRKSGQSIIINDNIKIMVVQIKGKQVRIGIEAPSSSKIFREEIYKKQEKTPPRTSDHEHADDIDSFVAKAED